MGCHISSIAVRSGEAEEAAHLATMAEIAALIVGNNAVPPGMPELLFRFSFDVKSQHSIDSISLTKSETSSALERIQTCALQLSADLQLPHIKAFMSCNSDVDYEGTENLEALLSLLARDAHRARKSPQIVKPGRGKAQLPGYKPAKYVCAAIVTEIWAFFHDGVYPAASNTDAQRAAALLWGSWIKPTKGWGNQPLNGWTQYLAANSEAVDIRKEVRRHLAIQANRFHKNNAA